MLVGVNTFGIVPSYGGGAERYLRNVLAKMREVQPDTHFVLFTDPVNHDSFEGWDRECLDLSQGMGLFSSADAQLDRAARRLGVDMLFSSLEAAPTRSSAPLVLFVLDVRRFEKDYLREHRAAASDARVARKICASAAAFVAPSEFTQRKLLECLDVPLNKVVVAPLGIDEAFGRPNPCALQPPFLLTVGCTHEFKNIPRMREAFEVLKDEFPHNLVVVGRPGDAEPDDWGPRVMRIEYCGSSHLAGLYQHADVYVQPSLYEGSGATVLEAMRAGTPVATSRTGGIPEAASETPIFFNPESTASIVAAIRWGIEESPEQRQRRVKFGKQVAAEFTWERCAWKTLSAFKRT